MCLGGVGSWDCRSRICSNGRCLEADSCKNLVQDGLETGKGPSLRLMTHPTLRVRACMHPEA